MAVSYITSTAAPGIGTAATIAFPSVASGAADLLLVLSAMRAPFDGDIVSGVTFGAASLTQLVQWHTAGVTEVPIAAHYLLSSSGVNDITTTFVSASAQRDAAYYLLSGVDQINPFGTLTTHHFTALATGMSGTTTNSVVGGLVVSVLGILTDEAASMTVTGATQTLRHAVSQSTSDTLATSTAPGAASVTMGYSWGGAGTAERNHVIIPINPASGAVVRVRSAGLLLGVG